MSNTKNVTVAETFTITEGGVTTTYRRTEKGYCTRDGKRISAEAFRAAEDLRDLELLDQIEDNLAWADATIAKVKEAEGGSDDRALTPDEMEELFDLRSDKLWSWYELAQRYGVTERAVREAFDFVRKLDDEAVEVTADEVGPTEGTTEEVYSDEAVPAKPEFEIQGVNKKQASVGHRNGHEYVHDWFGKRYFRDGEEITKFEYEHEVYGAEAPKAAKPKAKRQRRPKDVAGTYETAEGTVTLTAKQADFLREVGKLSEDELLGNVHGGVWCDILCDQIGGQFAGKPMSVGAMLSTICEKGLGERSKERREDGSRGKMVTVFRLTEKGETVWEAMGL